MRLIKSVPSLLPTFIDMDESEYHAMYSLEDTHWWFLAKRLFIRALIPKISKNSTILDIGSGTGGLTKFLSRLGNVTAVEESPIAIEYLKKRHLKYRSANIMTVALPVSRYDLVCCFDVLYHQRILDDTVVLRKLYRALKPGGYLCITDSALPILTSHHDVVMHTRERYTLSSLVKKVKACRFTVLKQTYLYFFVFPFVFFLRLVNKQIAFRSVTQVPLALNALLLFVCALEARLVPFINFPIGSSVFILARKSV